MALPGAADVLHPAAYGIARLACRAQDPARFLQMLRALAGKPVFTLEEHVLRGGFGSQVNAWYAQHGLPPVAGAFGLPDRFMAHGDRASLLAECGLDAESIALKIIKGETAA